MEALVAILAAFGIAAPAGLNAWLPLLMVGLAARFTNLITLSQPFDLLTNTWVLIALGVLLFVEIMADKIPVVDSANDAIHTFIRPVSGAILFAAQNDARIHLDPVLALIMGLVAAGSVHALKATTRPVITAATAGIANPFVSLVEDLVVVVSVLMALVAPVVAAVLLLIFLYFAVRLAMRWRRKAEERAAVRRV